jgi:two-component sensor histidine kinase
MALIHERLYQSTDLKHINFGEYIQSLANALFNTYVTDPSKIKLNFELEDIDVDINTAIPLGLIVNELITNSMKHGFPEDNSGKIDIKFGKIDDNLCLEVDDDGVGLPDDLDIQKTTTSRLKLVNSLTSQIDGELDLKKDDGTRFKITFKEEKF